MPEKHAHAGWLKKILEQKLAKVTKLRQVLASEFSLLAICHLSSVICDALRLIVSYWYYHKGRAAMTRSDKTSSAIDVSGPGNPIARPGQSA
jgi:hypothetical protein